MTADRFDIRPSRPADRAAIETLYPQAFPDEDLLPVVRDLLDHGEGVLSLVAAAASAEPAPDLVGHVAFTPCSLAGTAERLSMLAPLAVAPAWQRQGLGRALVREGVRRLAEAGVTRVFVLGDPAYYGRFGFEPERGVQPPYPLPEEWHDAWQSLGLGDTGRPGSPLRGTLAVPEPWRQPALWAP
ncbi:GNAT family N-acetyltransferase [Polymorphum gilvum]|nr:N-acetyltransferase [Polymorphum gilvum]